MAGRDRPYVLSTVLAIFLVVSSLGIAGALPDRGTAGAAGTSPAAAPAAPSPVPATGSPAPTAEVAPAVVPTSDAATAAADRALQAASAAHVRPQDVFVPRPSATPSEIARTLAGSPVRPLYSGSPAPMGLAYYGLSSAGGTVAATVLNTTAIRATVDLNATGVRSLDLFQTSPDGYGIQLNAVLTNVSLFGQGGYSFWTQNVVEIFPDAHFVQLVTNVWNFSSASAVLSPNALLYNGISGGASDGPNGTNDYGLLGFYYGQTVIPTPISYPFNLTIYLNSTIADHRDAVGFGIHLSGPGESFARTAWDYVIFNSTRFGGAPDTVPSNYTADGLHYNPLGLTNDFELIFGGPGGGSQSTLFAADATLGLAYNASGSFVPVPAAYSYGGETGETVTGANVAWNSSAMGGPDGDTTFGTMTTGPSILTGLWNATGSEGSFPLTLHTTPSNAISIVTPLTGNPEFTYLQPAVAPGAFTDTFYLTPGGYSVRTELSGYDPVTSLVTLSGPLTLNLALTPDPATGVYTPLWAFSNAGVAALAQAGNGTASSPYVLLNSQPAPLGVAFGLYNDFSFPVYPAVFFYQTNVAAEFLHPPSFATSTNLAQSPPLPATNDLQYWFWGVSNVSIVGASNISGWFDRATYEPTFFDTFSVIFYESTQNLVANNTFNSEGQGLVLFCGGNVFSGPVNVGGGNNTVWGNRFATVPSPPNPNGSPLLPVGAGLGIEIAEPHDLVYNNLVASSTTAFQVPLNIYSGAPEYFPVVWNISRQPASAVHFAAGFPLVPLTGSIIGTSYQGGNFWWDYGLALNRFNGANNAFDLIPYEERAQTPVLFLYGPAFYYLTYIFPGGDYVPLSNVALYPVQFDATPVAPGMVWGARVTNGSAVLDNFTSAAPTHTIELPNGTYTYTGFGVPNYTRFTGHPTTLTISGAGRTVTLAFHYARGVHLITFHRAGLPVGTSWTVTLNGTAPAGYVSNASATTTAGKLVFAVRAGTYDFTVGAVAGYTLNLPKGSVTVGGSGVQVHLKFTPYRFVVTFTESGLPSGTLWAVTVGKLTHSSRSSSIVFDLTNGTYVYKVHPKSGFATPAPGSLTVAGADVNVSVTFAPAALPAAPGGGSTPAVSNGAYLVAELVRAVLLRSG